MTKPKKKLTASEKKPARMGRPTALTPQIQNTLVAALKLGCYVETAVQFACIAKSSFYYWLQLAEKEQPGELHRDFSDAVQAAQAHAELTYVNRISKASETQWHAAAWMLENRFRQRWGRAPIEDKPNATRDEEDLDELTEEDLYSLLESIRRKKKELARARVRDTEKPKTH